ncbi:MAG: hypothetical protein LQ340_005835 [Diploschistes diacapsis]|nr:MAG: hypothetical protein LQ340_005835 [Diploschistes diacapsis]
MSQIPSLQPQQRSLAPYQSPGTDQYAISYQNAVLVQALTSPIAGIAILTVSLLLVLRLVKRRRLVGTDYAIVAALLLDCGLLAESLVSVNGATGNGVIYISVDGLTSLLKLIYAWAINYHLAKLATEVALLLMLRDTFKLEKRGLKYAWIATLVLTVLSGTVAAIVDAAQCIPVEHNWDLTRPGTCLNAQAVFIGTNAAVGASGVAILIFSFVQIVRDSAAWKYKALMLLYWIIGFL